MTSAAHCQAPSPATTWLGRTGTGRRCRTCVLAVDGVRPGVARAAATCCESCGAPSAAFLAFASSTHGDSQVLNLRKPVGGWAWRIHVLSATSTATNQNAWIDVMKQTLGQPQYAPLNLVDVVYGNDDDQTSQQQVQGLLQSYPNLQVIVSPPTVGIAAAAKVLTDTGNSGVVKLTGLGTPNSLRACVQDGTIKEFALWNVKNLGYLTYYVAAELVQREITGTPGEKFSVPTPGRLHHWRQQRHPAGAAPGLRQQQHRPVQVLTVVSFATPRRSSSTRSRSQRPLARARLSPG